MIERDIGKTILQRAEKYPIVTITGPRQSGKTTLAKALFSNKPYYNLEFPDIRQFVFNDPREFLKKVPNGAVIDEIQKAPTLLSYIQGITDQHNVNGEFILTGSSQFEMMSNITQSLAGRTSIIRLLPLSIHELKLFTDTTNFNNIIINGGYPRVYDKNIIGYEFYSDYFATYLERDIRQFGNIKNLSQFHKFVKLCAGRCGQLLNLSSLSSDIGISHTTLREWLSFLQAGFVIFLLEPYSHNINKRLVKTPKLYFYDTGLASYLLGIENTLQLDTHPLRGSLFENLVVSEYLKKRFNKGLDNNLSFYRDNSGLEVDLIIQSGQEIELIEIKASSTYNSDFSKNLYKAESIIGKAQKKIIYSGETAMKINGIEVLSPCEIEE